LESHVYPVPDVAEVIHFLAVELEQIIKEGVEDTHNHQDSVDGICFFTVSSNQESVVYVNGQG